ncbi:dihydrolipoyl dehydrogenase family protein, partial [Psychroserpens sp.]|uniref:dihydrolipoyl dehydrogenase family protein n=1 Tax=Psychroserpens sp. TaxID=2020870 RepID=UPI003C734F62
MEKRHYDVFVIGSGIAGQTAATMCAKNGLKVAIADKREYGGTCAIRGCDPKKIMMQFADLVHKSNNLKAKGVSKLPKVKWKTVQKFKSRYTDSVPPSTENDLKSEGIDLYHQSPKFISESEIEVEGKIVSADKFVIASGLVPRPLSFEGSQFLQTSDDILNLKKIPKSATFIGSGYVGMEFAYMLSTLGCKVTILEHGGRALSAFDPFLVDILIDSMRKIGVKFIFNAEPISVEKLKKNHRITYKLKNKTKSHKSRLVFNTAGRVPATGLLGLENANIKTDHSGVLVNNYMQSTSQSTVYACGDVSSASVPLTPLSGLQGYIAGHNLCFGNKKKFENPLVPSVVFTYPHLSMVGYSEEEAKRRYKSIKVFQGDVS